MKTVKSGAPSGVYAALLTPRRDGAPEADAGMMLDYIGRLEAAGVDGLVLFGSTGEFVHFESSERIRVACLALRRARVPVLVNVSHSDLAGVANLAESAIATGAQGILVMPPHFYRYDQAAIESFYGSVAELVADRIPIFLYNLPQHSNPIEAELALRLLACGRFAGIKDSSGDPQLLAALLELRRRHTFPLLAGNERLYRSARLGGADGTVSGVAAALPELMLAWDRALVAADDNRSRALEVRLFEYLDWLERFPATFLIRQTAALRGWVNGQPSLPVSSTQQTDWDRFRAWFAEWFPQVQAEVR